MTEINNIHDTFFRETMSHKKVAADFLANYLPAGLLAYVKLETLLITKDTFVDKKQATHYSDLNPAISTSVCPNAARLSNFWKLMSPKGTPESSIVEF